MKASFSSSLPRLRGLAPDEAAAQWIIRLNSDALSAAERQEFDAWRAASPANKSAYAQAEQMWALFDEPNEDPTLDAIRASALAAGRQPKRGLWLGAGFGIAASLLAALTLNAGSIPFLKRSDAVPLASNNAPANASRGEHAAADEFATAKGERRTIRLADGSGITLNTDSAVRVTYANDRRVVHLLRGQALFSVMKDVHRPFVVQARDQQVTALGTVFEVRLETNRIKVTLVEGKVVVDGTPVAGPTGAHNMTPTILAPGQSLITDGGNKPELAKVDVDQQLRWREGFVEFNDVSLAEAVTEMNRYSDKQILIADGAIEKLRVSGVFRTGNSERFASIIGELLPIQQRKLTSGDVVLTSTS